MNTFILDNDKEYKLIKKIIFNNNEYYYLVDKDNYNIYVIAKIIDNKVCIVDDKNLLRKLVVELYKTNNYEE